MEWLKANVFLVYPMIVNFNYSTFSHIILPLQGYLMIAFWITILIIVMSIEKVKLNSTNIGQELLSWLNNDKTRDKYALLHSTPAPYSVQHV